MSDLEQIISDSIDDATAEPEVDSTTELDASADSGSDVGTDHTPDTSETGEMPVGGVGESAEGADSTSPEVASPAAKQGASEAKPGEDEFAKKHGLPQPVAGQRENRIPYPRVKQIVKNAEAKAIEPYTKQVADFQTKVTEYETRLDAVGKFENMMMNDHVSFLRMLVDRVPGYRQLFEQMQPAQQQAPVQEQQKPVADDDPMPEPNTKLADGSMVYDLDGLKARDAWNRRQAQKATMAEVDQKYGNFIKEQQDQQAMRQKYEALIPQVQQQVQVARQWPHFKENEDAITELLARNPQLSLEGAYAALLTQKVLPKLQLDKESFEKTTREETRKQVIAELKKAPSTAAPASGIKPRPAQVGGTRTLEDIIKEQVDASGLR